jgi:hypothetical protein
MPASGLLQSSDHESEPAVRSSPWPDLASLGSDLGFLSADLAFLRAELDFEASDHAIEASDHAIEAGKHDDQGRDRLALCDDRVHVSGDRVPQAPARKIESANHESLSGAPERVSPNLGSLGEDLDALWAARVSMRRDWPSVRASQCGQ